MTFINRLPEILYNEIDPFAAAWLRELVKANAIAPGEVIQDDIRDLKPADLKRYTQCHFFAGIGVWSYALRRAGWADDRPVWTGSCPCQPFSAAGRGDGFADERHLWPHWNHLIGECRPAIVVGEQVASKDGLGWLDLVSTDLEGQGYAVGASDLCAAGVGAPHIRQRLYFAAIGVADTDDAGSQGRGQPGRERAAERAAGARGVADGLADAASGGWREERADERGFGSRDGTQGRPAGSDAGRESGGLADTNDDGRGAGHSLRPNGKEHDVEHGGGAGGLADTDGETRRKVAGSPCAHEATDGRARWDGGQQDSHNGPASHGQDDATGQADGFWRDADWLLCRDGKWRPVEPGTFPLAHGVAARVGRLRGYGNAIVAEAARTFVESVMDVLDA